MTILVTGFSGKVGFEVARKLEEANLPFVCAVRDVPKAKAQYGDRFIFVPLDLSKPDTFAGALDGIDKLFLMYPPGENLKFARFIESAKALGVNHIVYLSLKDVQMMPFVPHYKNEKLIKKSGVPYTFLRAGYFMQNLQDFLLKEIKANQRIFVPAGKGKTSFVDARDIAEIAVLAFKNTAEFAGQKPVITGNEAWDFYDVAKMMTEELGESYTYANPTVKEFKKYMVGSGADEAFINVVVGVHFPTKLGLAGGIKLDYEKLMGKAPTTMRQYLKDHREKFL